MLKLSGLAATALIATTALALAQSSPTPAPGAAPPARTDAPRADAPRGRDTVRRSDEFQAVQNAKVSLAQAIETAERQGGRAISAEFEGQGGNEPAHYEIKVLANDGKLVEHDIDANTGQVTKSENQPFERYFTRLKATDLQNARTSLRQAITLAEQKAGQGAKVVEAEVEREGDVVQYEITVASADREQEFTVDANGQVKADD